MAHFHVHGEKGEKAYFEFQRPVGLNKPRGEGSHVTQQVTSSEITTLSVIRLGFVIFYRKMSDKKPKQLVFAM